MTPRHDPHPIKINASDLKGKKGIRNWKVDFWILFSVFLLNMIKSLTIRFEHTPTTFISTYSIRL